MRLVAVVPVGKLTLNKDQWKHLKDRLTPILKAIPACDGVLVYDAADPVSIVAATICRETGRALARTSRYEGSAVAAAGRVILVWDGSGREPDGEVVRL